MPDVIGEANFLLNEAKSRPMSYVLGEYIKYLTDNPDVNKSPVLSQQMSSQLGMLLPDLIVEDIKESSGSDTVRLRANESISDLSEKTKPSNPRAELAKQIMADFAFFKAEGLVSADGASINLGALKLESRDGHRLLTNDGNISQEYLVDGTVLWRDQDMHIIAAQYQNGMVVQLAGNDGKNITSQQDLMNSSYTPVRIYYPNGSKVDQDPDKHTWFFTDAKTGLIYPTADLSWNTPSGVPSPYFQSLLDKYVVPMVTATEEGETVSRQATFNRDGDLVILTKTAYTSDGNIDANFSEVIDSVTGYLKLANEPAYSFDHSTNRWQIENPAGSAHFIDVAGDQPKITSKDGHLDVVLPADSNRGINDMFPGGRHTGYFPNGFSYDADYQRLFADGVQIYNLRSGTNNLNQPSRILLPETGIVVLPDNTTIQTDHGQWYHYAYAGDPLNPLTKGALLGAVSQPVIDYDKDVSSDTTAQHIYFQTDNRDAAPVPFSNDSKSLTYSIQVNGSLETFAYGGALSKVTRRDGSTVEYSSTLPAHPVKISFKNVAHPANVNVDDVVFDESSQQWMRDGKQVQVDGLDQSSGFAQLTITDVSTQSKDVFPGGGLDPSHTEVQGSATPEAPETQNGKVELSINSSSSIEVTNGVPSSLVLDETDVVSMSFTPMLGNAKNRIAIPASAIPAGWANNHSDISFQYSYQNSTYTITVSGDLKTVTVTSSGDREIFNNQGVQYQSY